MKNFFLEKTSSKLEVGDTIGNENLHKTLSIPFFLILKKFLCHLRMLKYIYLKKKTFKFIYWPLDMIPVLEVTLVVSSFPQES